MNTFSKYSLALGVVSALALMASPAHAVVTYATDSTLQSNIPSLTGFATTGAMMDGMGVAVTFASGFTQTLAWADTGASSGGVTGNGWSLNLTGDTFSALWNFSNTRAEQITQLVLTGNTGFTVFDRTNPSFGTDGSAQGRDLVFQDAGIDALVTYSDEVAVIPNAPVGDLWHTVTVAFQNNTGPRGDFTFQQDTDNDSRINDVPEPAILSLFGVGLLGASVMRRASKKVCFSS